MVMPQEATQAPNWASLIVEDIEETFFSVDTNWRFTYLNHHAASMFGRSKEALLGKVLWEAFPSLIGSKFEPVYRQTMAEGTPHRVEDFSTTTQSWYDVWAYPIPHGLIIYFQDITARKRVEAELLRQAERARVQAEVSHALAEVTHDYQATLNMSARQLAEIVGDACLIRLIANDGQWFERPAFYHPDPEAAAFVRDLLGGDEAQPINEGLSGRVAQSGQPVRIPVISSAQLKAMTDPKQWPYFDRFTVSSVMIVPLHATGRVIGILAMTRNTSGRPYTEDDQIVVRDLADRVAMAIINARLLQQVQSELAERVRTEAALRFSEERFKVLSEAAYEALLIHENGIIVEANQRAAELTGYVLDELIGMSVEQLVVPEILTRVRKNLATNSEYIGESIAVRKDGTRFIVETRGKLIDYQGRRIRLVAVRDITDLKQAEEALRASEARFTGIVSSAMDAIISIDESLRIVVFNAAAEQMFRCSATAVIGQPLDQFLPASVRDLHAEYIRGFGRTGMSSRSMGSLATLTAIRADGETFPIEATISQTLAAGQQLFTVIIRDITERRRLEAQLLHTQKMESIGQLAGGIAHDFNNMLSAIIGFIGSAQEQLPEDHPAQHDLKVAEGSAWRAAGLTRQLLAFARKQVVEPHVLNLNKVIVEMDKLLRRLIGEDIELVTLPAPDLGQVKADPGQIEQVIANLVVNARDAMTQGGRLTIETANTTLDATYARQHVGVTPGNYVMLAVSDTGSGMDATVQQHIFEPFYTTKEVGKGTGLGLATCYAIAKQHGGNIWVYSEVGQGTTFKIYLPQVNEAADTRSQSADDVPVPRGTETVLLVEDEPLVREITSHILREQGYTVLEAGNGADALRITHEYAGATIALLITDVVMPQMGGKALAEQVTSVYRAIKVLFISGYAADAIVHHGRLEPGATFLSKPFTPAAFARKVREVLDAAAANSPSKTMN